MEWCGSRLISNREGCETSGAAEESKSVVTFGVVGQVDCDKWLPASESRAREMRGKPMLDGLVGSKSSLNK